MNVSETFCAEAIRFASSPNVTIYCREFLDDQVAQLPACPNEDSCVPFCNCTTEEPEPSNCSQIDHTAEESCNCSMVERPNEESSICNATGKEISRNVCNCPLAAKNANVSSCFFAVVEPCTVCNSTVCPACNVTFAGRKTKEVLLPRRQKNKCLPFFFCRSRAVP